MASLDDKSLFEDIFRLENDTPAEAIGPEGDISYANIQAQQLANRTRWLRTQLVSIGDFREYTFFKTAEDPDGTIAGRANTPNNKLFRVSQGEGDELAFKYYLHKDGIAIPDTTLIGIGSIKNTIRVFPTLAVAQADADAGNITSGSTAYYRNPDDSALAIEVINIGGTLKPTGLQMPSTKTVDNKINERLVPGKYLSTWFPVFFDRNRNVYAWFDGGRWDVADFGANARTIIESVPNAWAQKFLPQGDYSPNYFPFVHDRNGNVYAWFHNGMYDGYGFGPNIEKYILNLVGGASAKSDSSFIEGDQYKFNFKKGRVFSGQAASVNTAFFGDSWNEKNTIPQSLINVLGGIFKDPAWISCSNRADGVMAGISPVVATNFTKYDGGSNNTNPPPYGCGPDGNGYYNNNTVGSLAWTGITATDLSVFYYDGSGSFTITIDGGTPVTVNGANTGAAKKHDISGLSATAHSVTIQSLGSGVVSILGMYGKNSAVRSGVTVSRMGNGGAIGSDFFNFSDWIKPVAQYLDIDLLFVILGTNDFRLSKGTTQYKNGLVEIITKFREATPGICICLVSPGHCNATGTPALSEYDAVMRELAVEYNVNFISGYELFPKTYDNSNGAWEDGLHLSSLGAYILTNKIKKEFFQE
ncbi:SGNH/GDSL hydrolase family protein [Klebsiella variicola]|uniref:SGNH/GDSL hydrolase family protein n=1 Tax=Klebsiella variicola TaxID=244366 RepID=UPI001F54A759|nr:GDSL-type esterase/lipase family protein [Klebsiella variicola]